MSNLKMKLNNFNNSLKKNGIKTEIRRAFNYLKYKKTVPNEYEEWSLLNEPNNEKEIERQKKYKPLLNTKFLILVQNEETKKLIGNQTYSNYEVVVSKPEDFLENIKKYESDFCIFIGQDIKLQPFCLFAIQDFIEYNECNIIYSDNDYINNGKRVNPEFKPHFAYYNLLSKNYTGNFLVIKTRFIKENQRIRRNSC